jgi:hypothetical protein
MPLINIHSFQTVGQYDEARPEALFNGKAHTMVMDPRQIAEARKYFTNKHKYDGVEEVRRLEKHFDNFIAKNEQKKFIIRVPKRLVESGMDCYDFYHYFREPKVEKLFTRLSSAQKELTPNAPTAPPVPIC